MKHPRLYAFHLPSPTIWHTPRVPLDAHDDHLMSPNSADGTASTPYQPKPHQSGAVAVRVRDQRLGCHDGDGPWVPYFRLSFAFREQFTGPLNQIETVNSTCEMRSLRMTGALAWLTGVEGDWRQSSFGQCTGNAAHR